jgi:DNA polymerase-4
VPPCRDTLTLLRALGPLWERKPRGTPLRVGVVLGHLLPDRSTAPALFTEDRRLHALADAMDRLNQRFGAHTVYFAGMWNATDQAPTKIAFTRVPDTGTRDA